MDVHDLVVWYSPSILKENNYCGHTIVAGTNIFGAQLHIPFHGKQGVSKTYRKQFATM